MDCSQPMCEMVTERGWNIAEFVSFYWPAVNKKNYFSSIVFKVRNQQSPGFLFTLCVSVHVHCAAAAGMFPHPSLADGRRKTPTPTAPRSHHRLARMGRGANLAQAARCLQDAVPSSSRGPGGRALGPRGAACCPMGRHAAGRGRGVPGFLLLRPDPRAPALCGPARRSFRFPFPLPGFPWRPGSVSERRRTRRGTRRASGGMTPPGRKTTTRRRTRMAMKASLRERRRPPGRSRRMRRSLCWARHGNPGRPRWVPAGPAGLLSPLHAGREAPGRAGRAAEPCVHLSERLLRLQPPAPRRVSPCPCIFCIFLARLLFVVPVFWAPFPSYPDLQPGTGADEA